jgi:predicted short-subunit dehydrogenase-like oxidoreductase (DUF2520 family)
MKIVIIGAGNVAQILGRRIVESGHELIQVFSRTIQHARQFGGMLNAMQCNGYFTDATDTVDNIRKDGDVYLIAISDDALPEVTKQFHFGNALTVHTAGAMPMELLETVSAHHGVLYPLQSLRKEMSGIPTIPLLLDANTSNGYQLLNQFAGTLSPLVMRANNNERLKLHIAAVITGNFTNHLYALAQDYCRKEGVDFSLLFPLITETANRLHHYPPDTMQTGPAIRHDIDVIEKHLEMLNDHPLLREVYKTLSVSISTFHKKV